MKRPATRSLLWVVAVLLAALAIWAYTRLSTPSLLGTWSNGATESPVSFVFNPDGSGTMVLGKARLDYRYTFDPGRKPAWLDLETVGAAPVTIRAIAEFAPGGRLKIRMPFTRAPGTRPSEFIDDDVENTILLKRGESAS